MRRAIEPDGRLVVAVWKSVAETPFFRDLYQVAERRLGTFVDRRHSFGDARALERLIADAGFRDIRVDSPTLTIRFAEPAMFGLLNSNAVVGMSAAAAAMTDDERARLISTIAEDSDEVLRQYTDGGALAFELGANVAMARAK
jgi:hypothetical protein